MNFAKAIIYHHLSRMLCSGEEISAFYNCHVMGLHSIVLGGDTRMFFTTEEHEMWRNEKINDNMTLAIHSHRFDTTLIPVYGQVVNHTYELVPVGKFRGDVRECHYTSAIHDGELSLAATGNNMAVLDLRHRLLDEPIFMRNTELHTVSVSHGYDAAWLVMEGWHETEKSKPCYTNNLSFNTEGMYAAMPRVDAIEHLRRIHKENNR